LDEFPIGTLNPFEFCRKVSKGFFIKVISYLDSLSRRHLKTICQLAVAISAVNIAT